MDEDDITNGLTMLCYVQQIQIDEITKYIYYI